MSKIGLNEQQIDKILKENGLYPSDKASVENIRKAISVAIVQNNKKIEKEVTEFVAAEFKKEMKMRGLKF